MKAYILPWLSAVLSTCAIPSDCVVNVEPPSILSTRRGIAVRCWTDCVCVELIVMDTGLGIENSVILNVLAPFL